MSFASVFNDYCNEIDCTNSDLARICGISPSSLSRYRHGERTPEANSRIVKQLADGIATLSRNNAHAPLEAKTVHAALEAEIAGTCMVGMDFHMRLDSLMHLLGMSNTALAEAIGVDPSYISRIRRGQRMPSNLPRFTIICAHLAAIRCIEDRLFDELGELVGVPDLATGHPEWDPYEESNVAEIVDEWLKGNQIIQADVAKLGDLLLWLDETDFSQWLSMNEGAVGDTIDPPSPVARFYYGINGMRSAELDFLDMAAKTHARSMSLSTDMPLMHIPPGSRFIKQYGEAMINVLKTGCSINVFYNIERPLEDTIRSLRIWMPIYLSGQVTPYYFKGVNNRLFYHMNYVCDTCALSSEAVVDHIEEGRYYFTTRPKDVSYYQRKMGFVLEKASSLLEIYRDCDPGQQEAFERGEAKRRAKGKAHRIGEDRFHNLHVTHYLGDCTALTLPCGPTAVHFVIRHPKINYIVARMK